MRSRLSSIFLLLLGGNAFNCAAAIGRDPSPTSLVKTESSGLIKRGNHLESAISLESQEPKTTAATPHELNQQAQSSSTERSEADFLNQRREDEASPALTPRSNVAKDSYGNE